jgi:uncharacterized sulfatase
MQICEASVPTHIFFDPATMKKTTKQTMNHRLFAGAVLLLASLASLHAAEKKPAAPPNVLIFVTDDESWLERSVYGWSKISTPNLDRLAKQGVLFTHAYCSAPSCAPSRASLLTGRNFWELEEGAFIQAWLPAKFATLPDLMEAGGYSAGYTGKGWGPPESYAWGPNTLPQSGRKRNPAGNVFNSIKREHEPDMSDIDYPANFEKFLAERPQDRPFWFWVGTQEPHAPCAKNNHEKLQVKYGITLDDIKVPGFLPDTPGVRRGRGNMLYEVCHADEDLGKILKILEARGQLENTILIATGDNGTQVLRSKANIYDWGLHEPLAVLWPARIKPGRQVDDFVSFVDFAPTILEAAGLPIPREMSGRSFLNVLLSPASGKVDLRRSWVSAGLEWHGEKDPVNLAGRMIRDERYEYIVNYGTGPRRILNPSKVLPDSEYEHTAETGNEIDLITKHPEHPLVKPFMRLLVSPRPHEELYDSQTDVWQTNNLAELPQYAAIKEKLKKQLEAYQRKTKDPRITGDMEIFKRTRAYVQNVKYGKKGYGNKEDE